MKILWILIVLATAICGFSADEEIADGLLALTKENFHEVIEGNEFVLVVFNAPWCTNCKEIPPEFVNAVETLTEKESSIKLAKVNANVEHDLVEEFKLLAFPTIIFFRSGNPIQYRGNGQSTDIVWWVMKKINSLFHNFETVEESERFLENNSVAVIGFFKNQECIEAQTFISVARTMDTLAFGITSNDAVIAKYDATDGAVMLFKPSEGKKFILSGEINFNNLGYFIQKQSLPLFIDFNEKTASKIFGITVKFHMLLFVSKEAGHKEKFVHPLKDVAQEYLKHILFIVVSSDEKEYQHILEYFGVAKEEVPAVRLISLNEDMAKYRPEENDMSVEAIRTFIQDCMAGKLKRYLTAQNLPEDWDKNPVKVLVASNFEEVVKDKSKDVLVEFYAPLCDGCRELEIIYDQLGEKFEGNESVVIAKLDLIANELENTKISTFPTIKLYRKGDNKVIDYKLDRTLDNLVEFLESSGGVNAMVGANIERDEF